MKIQISIREELLRKIDEDADKNFMTRSGYISYVMTQYLKAKEQEQQEQTETNKKPLKEMDLFK